MLIGDILHTCANERVAEAAVASIGGDFAARLARIARRDGTSVGSLASEIVRDFSVEANERDHRRVREAMSGDDTPVLSGLQAVIETRLTDRAADGWSEVAERGNSHGADVATPVWTIKPNLCIGARSAA